MPRLCLTLLFISRLLLIVHISHTSLAHSELSFDICEGKLKRTWITKTLSLIGHILENISRSVMKVCTFQ